MSPLIHQALLHAQYEAESRGEPLKIDINNMSDLQRLRFFSKVLEGPLKLMSSVGGSWIPLYFKATERRSGKWEWQYWNSKEECLVSMLLHLSILNKQKLSTNIARKTYLLRLSISSFCTSASCV